MPLEQRIVNIGTAPNDGTGDKLRDSFEKVNENFSDIYSELSNSRENISFVTQLLDESDVDDIDVEAYKGYMLYQISTSNAAWVRLYTTNAARIADSARLQGEPAAPNSGLIAEAITSSAGTVLMSPGVFGFNNEFPVTNIIPVSVTNLGNNPANITCLLTLIKIET